MLDSVSLLALAFEPNLRPTSGMNFISWEFYSSNVDLPFISTSSFLCFYLLMWVAFWSIAGKKNKGSTVTHLRCFYPCLGSKPLCKNFAPSSLSQQSFLPKILFLQSPHLCHLHWWLANCSWPTSPFSGSFREDQTGFSGPLPGFFHSWIFTSPSHPPSSSPLRRELLWPAV